MPDAAAKPAAATGGKAPAKPLPEAEAPLTGSGAPSEEDAVEENAPGDVEAPPAGGHVVQDNVSEPGVQKTIAPDGSESRHNHHEAHATAEEDIFPAAE
jgi:hypothetical protein